MLPNDGYQTSGTLLGNKTAESLDLLCIGPVETKTILQDLPKN